MWKMDVNPGLEAMIYIGQGFFKLQLLILVLLVTPEILAIFLQVVVNFSMRGRLNIPGYCHESMMVQVS